VATAHKIARIVYHLLKTGESYREESDAEYERKRQQRELRHLSRRAQKLGYTLNAIPAPAPESPPEGGSQAVSDERRVRRHAADGLRAPGRT
jgi:hypothetical protein